MKPAFYAAGERVTELKRRLMETAPATTEHDLAADLLRLVNARGAELAGLVDGAVAAAAQVDVLLSAASGRAQSVMADYTRQTTPFVQQWAAGELAKVVDGRGTLLRVDAARPGVTDTSAIEGPLVVERIVGGMKSPRTERRFAFAGIHDFAQWAVLWLQQRHRAQEVELCRCRLEECGRFFFAIESGGRTRRTFCSEDHMQEHHRKSSAERVARSRANRRRAR